MQPQPITPVRAFISYSWTSPQHKAWVLELAKRLLSDGIDIELDTWALQPGRDPISFMEQMVTDKTVKKVIMVCDRMYKEKADGREGGVGKEAQILTAEIYEKASEDKYAAIITEVDDNGKAYVPAYYHSKQYIDFADATKIEDSYQELVRWLYDKPQHVKPKVGVAPSFITEPNLVTTATTSKLKQAEHAIKTQSAASGGAMTDFGDAMIAEFEELRATQSNDEPWDETVIKAAAAMRPALRNLIELVLAEARYGGSHFDRILGIFERIGAFMYRPAIVSSWRETDYDSYRVMAYEGFLSLVAILLRERRFELLQTAITHPYLIEGRESYEGPATATFRVFNQEVESFQRRQVRLQSRLIDPFADYIVDLYKVSFPPLNLMMEADLILFLRGQFVNDGSGSEMWWPRTLLYANGRRPTELFARSESIDFFNSWVPKLFGSMTPDVFKQKVIQLQESSRSSWGSPLRGPNLVLMTNAHNLGTRS